MESLFLFCEDTLSEAVMSRMVKEIVSDTISFKTIGKKGKGYIQNKINDINDVSPILTFFVLTDLDRIECAPVLINDWFSKPIRDNLIFRVAVKEVEAWVLADIKGISEYLSISETVLKREIGNPDELLDPKMKLLSLVYHRSRKKHYKEDIVKKTNSSFKQGAGYNTRLTDFIIKNWNLDQARAKSLSLEKACTALEKLKF